MKEIERKFIVRSNDWKNEKLLTKCLFTQGLIVRKNNGECTVRVRLVEDMIQRVSKYKEAFLTVKHKISDIIRNEFEYKIPYEDGKFMLLHLCDEVIEKIRYTFIYKNNTWEIDEYLDNNQGLVIAEIELKTENQEFEIPYWVGEDITTIGIRKFFNKPMNKEI